MPELIAFADDLTGALETGAQFAAESIGCIVSMNASMPAETDGVVLNLATRHLAGEIAEAAVREAIAASCARAAPYLFFKTDSTLRGPIAESFRVLLSEFPERKIIYAPAYPAHGRTVRDAVLYVNGVPLSKTSFLHDPLNPARQDSLFSLLQPALDTAVAVATSAVQARALLESPGTRLIICDAESEDDLEMLAAELRFNPTRWIIAGSGAMCRHWAGTLPIRRSSRHAMPAIENRNGIIVIGSRHPASREQAHYAIAVGIPPVEAQGTLSMGELAARLTDAVRSRGWAILCPPHEASGPPLEMAQNCGAIAAAAVEQSSPDVLIIFGGDTAEATLHSLGCELALPLGELLPGVPVSEIQRRQRTMLLVTKAGGFGGETTLCRILDELGKFT